MKTLRRHRQLIGWFMTCLMATWLPGPIALNAATLYWDSDAASINNVATGGGLGGFGIWNTTGSNWWDGTSLLPSTLFSWNNGNNDTAVFTGTANTVVLGSAITVGGLQFNTTGYALGTAGNTNVLTFGDFDNTVTLNNIAAATINGSLAGNNVILNGGVFGGATAGVLTLAGTAASQTGWSGSTTINNGMTMALSQNSRALLSTSDITLNGGGITLTNTTAAEAALNRVNNAAAISSNGGTITVTNTVAAATPYAETIGAITLNAGRLNIVSTNANTGGTQVLVLSGLSNTGTSSVSIAAGTALNTTTNRVNVTGATATTAGQIIGPWLTTGTTAAALNDYGVFDASGNILPANIAATANDSTWTNPANSYTLNGATTLTATDNMTGLRYTGAAATLALGVSNLGTTGILNGGSGLLTITSTTGVVTLPSTTSANLYISASNGQGITISAPINDNGSGSLTLVNTGTNTTTLSSTTSNYTGGTVINAGTISIAADTNLGDLNGDISFNNAGNAAALSITGATQTIGAGRDIFLNNGSIATINTTNASVTTIQGIISGTGGLIATPVAGGRCC